MVTNIIFFYQHTNREDVKILQRNSVPARYPILSLYSVAASSETEVTSDKMSASLSSSMVRLETSPFKEETSSSPVTDGAGEASVLVHVVVVL